MKIDLQLHMELQEAACIDRAAFFHHSMQENMPMKHSLHCREIRSEAGNLSETGITSF